MRSITIRSESLVCTVTEDPVMDETIWGIVTLLKQALVGIGFHPENVDDIFITDDRWTKRKEDSC